MSKGGSTGPSQGEVAMSEIALDQWRQFAKPVLERASPVQAERASNENYRRDIKLGNVNAATQQAFGKAQAGLENSLQSRAIDPSSGKFKSALLQNSLGKADALGVNESNALQGIKNEASARQGAAVLNNLGLSAGSLSGFSSVANNQQSQANAQLQANNVYAQGIGNAVGTGVGLYSQLSRPTPVAQAQSTIPQPGLTQSTIPQQTPSWNWWSK